MYTWCKYNKGEFVYEVHLYGIVATHVKTNYYAMNMVDLKDHLAMNHNWDEEMLIAITKVTMYAQ
jgi:hypothetical protein